MFPFSIYYCEEIVFDMVKIASVIFKNKFLNDYISKM